MARRLSTGGYWASQLVPGAVFGVAGLVGGPIAMTLDTEEPGRGLIYFLVGVVFLVFFIVMLRKYLKSSRSQRAAYAWVISQQGDLLRDDGVNPGNDMRAVAMAERARTGTLTAKEIADLQALRPDVPYPGEIPSSEPPTPDPGRF